MSVHEHDDDGQLSDLRDDPMLPDVLDALVRTVAKAIAKNDTAVVRDGKNVLRCLGARIVA